MEKEYQPLWTTIMKLLVAGHTESDVLAAVAQIFAQWEYAGGSDGIDLDEEEW